MAISSIKTIWFGVALGALVLSQTFSQTQKERLHAKTLVSGTFAETVRIVAIVVPLRQADKDSLRLLTKQDYAADSLHLLAATNGDLAVGFAVVDNVKGKDQYITYCVIVDEMLNVKQVEILAYREPYGGEVQNKSWLKQFFDKQPDDNLRPGREIKNITGATISARSVTLGVKKVLSLLQIVKPRLPLTNYSTR